MFERPSGAPPQTSGQEGGRPTPQRATRLLCSPAAQVTGLSLLVGLPLLILVGSTLWAAAGQPTLTPDGDGAQVELSTLHTLSSLQLEGHGSRCRFRQPGPMLFYVLAPLYWLTGCSYLGIHLTAGLVQLAVVVAVLAVVRRCAGPTGMLWSALLLTLYIGFVRADEIVSSWPAKITIMPFVLACVLFAAVAAGRLGYLPVALLVAAFVAQTHIAYVPALATLALASLLLGTVPTLRRWLGIRGARSGSLLWVVPVCLLLLALLWAPVVIEQLTATPGNISRLVGFFARHGVCHCWPQTLAELAGALSDFPLRCLGGTAAAVSHGEGPLIHEVVAAAQVLMVLASYWLARRHAGDFQVALCLLFALLLGVLAVSIRHIEGPILDHLVLWMSSLSLLGLMAIGGSLLLWVGTLLQPEARGEGCGVRGARSGIGPKGSFEDPSPPAPLPASGARGGPVAVCGPWLCRGAVVAALAAILLGSALNVRAIWAELPDVPYRGDPQHIGVLVEGAREVLRRGAAGRCVVRILDRDTWPVAAGVVLQLTKAGFPPAVEREWLLMFGSGHARRQQVDGILLFCDRQRGRRLLARGGLKPAAETPEVLLLWWPAAAKVRGRYSFGDLDTFAWEYDGFWPSEGPPGESYCWSKGMSSWMVVHLEQGQAYRLGVSLKPLVVPGKTQTMAILLGDQVVGELSLPAESGWQEHKVILPAGRVRGTSTIVFRYRYAEFPGEHQDNLDRRRLAVQFRSITFEPIGEGPHPGVPSGCVFPEGERGAAM